MEEEQEFKFEYDTSGCYFDDETLLPLQEYCRWMPGYRDFNDDADLYGPPEEREDIWTLPGKWEVAPGRDHLAPNLFLLTELRMMEPDDREALEACEYDLLLELAGDKGISPRLRADALDEAVLYLSRRAPLAEGLGLGYLEAIQHVLKRAAENPNLQSGLIEAAAELFAAFFLTELASSETLLPELKEKAEDAAV